MALSKILVTKPLSGGKKYHYSVLYNHLDGPPDRRQGDHLLAWNFLTDLNERLFKLGYDNVMYHDEAIPGSNIFDNLFYMVNESEKIIVLLTPEFLQNGWHQFSGQAAMKKLLDRNEAKTRIIPIAIQLQSIPDNLGLSNTIIIYTDYHNNTADDNFWIKVYRAMGPNEIHYEPNGPFKRAFTWFRCFIPQPIFQFRCATLQPEELDSGQKESVVSTDLNVESGGSAIIETHGVETENQSNESFSENPHPADDGVKPSTESHIPEKQTEPKEDGRDAGSDGTSATDRSPVSRLVDRMFSFDWIWDNME